MILIMDNFDIWKSVKSKNYSLKFIKWTCRLIEC